MKKIRWIILALVTVALFCYIYFSEGLDRVLGVFSSLDWRYMGIGAFFQITVYLFEALLMWYARRKYQKVPYGYAVYSTFFGLSLNSLIPPIFAAGPMAEVGVMNMQGLEADKGGAVVLYKQCNYFVAYVIVPLVLFLTAFRYFAGAGWLLKLLLFAGFVVNSGTALVYLLIARADRFLFAIASFFVNLGHSMHIVGNRDALLEKIHSTLQQLKARMKNLPYGKRDWTVTLLIACIEILCSYTVSYYAAMALGIQLEVPFYVLMAASAFVATVQVTLPLPSGLGIADLAYNRIMLPIAGDKINFLLLLWRLISFYLPILVSIVAMMLPVPGRNHRNPAN